MCCHSRQQAEQVKARLAEWLEPKGLAFNEAKTRIVHLSEGFGFLSFDLRRYPNGKLLIKPGADAIKRFRKRLAKEFRTFRGASVAAVLAKIVPIVRGWVAYYRTVVLSRVFPCPDRIPVEAHLQVGVLESPEQAETLDRRPVLPEVRQVQERSLGVRRPEHRRLPSETGLD